MVLKARVINGRIVVNEPTSLPEGTELELVPSDEPGTPVSAEERIRRVNALMGKYGFVGTSVDDFLKRKHEESDREEG